MKVFKNIVNFFFWTYAIGAAIILTISIFKPKKYYTVRLRER